MQHLSNLNAPNDDPRGDSRERESGPTGRSRGRPRSRSQARSQSRRAQAARRPLPTQEDLIRALHSIPTLVATGVLQPAEANAIRGAIDSTLRALGLGGGASPAAPGRTPPLERLRELLDAFPQGIDILEPLLGDEVVSQLFADEPETDQLDPDDIDSAEDAGHDDAP